MQGVMSVRREAATLSVALVLFVLWASISVAEQANPPTRQPYAAYEVWATDQGTNKIHIIAPDPKTGGAGFVETEVIDLGTAGIDMPHMIDFTSDFAYAFVANVQSGNVAVIRTADRKLLKVIETGPMTHMAAVLPNDSAVLVDVMHTEGAIVEITVDREKEAFNIGRKLKIAQDPLFQQRAAEFPGASPVCHDYTTDGAYAFVSLGPPLDKGGLLILDVKAFQLSKVFPVSEIRVNCGTIRSPDGSKMYLNGGSLTEGHWYVFDTTTHRPLPVDEQGTIQRDSRGKDAHGVWFTPDGGELWMVNRASSNAIIIDPASDKIIAEIEHVGPSPDILTMSPDGKYAFITLRGPKPRSGPHQIAGTRPGVSVIDVKARKLVTILELAKRNEKSDFHGIGLRPF